jgi:hypothetical protein
MAADYRTLLGLLREAIEARDTDPNDPWPGMDWESRARAAIAPSEPKPEKLKPPVRGPVQQTPIPGVPYQIGIARKVR